MSSTATSLPPVSLKALQCACRSLAPLEATAERRVIIFYHIAAINNWQEIVEAQVSNVVFSGLYDRATTIFCGISGPDKEVVEQASKLVTGYGQKFQILKHGVKSKAFERLTLHLIRRNTVAADAILYFHSKGVSGKHQKSRTQLEKSHWRFIMEYWLMRHHPECIDALSTFHTVGASCAVVCCSCCTKCVQRMR